MNKLQWNFNRNSYIFTQENSAVLKKAVKLNHSLTHSLTQENAFENVVWRTAAILSQPQCVKWWLVSELACSAPMITHQQIKRIKWVRPKPNGLHFAGNIFKWFFLSDIICISIKITTSHYLNWNCDQDLSYHLTKLVHDELTLISLVIDILTLNKMADILQIIFSNAVSSVKVCIFWFKFHRSLIKQQANADPVHWHIYASLTHWGRVMHICIIKLTTIGSDNGLLPGRRQAIIWTNAGIVLIGPLGTNFIETLIEMHTFSLKKMHLKMSSGKWRPFCLGLNVLRDNESPSFVHNICSCNIITLRKILINLFTFYEILNCWLHDRVIDLSGKFPAVEVSIVNIWCNSLLVPINPVMTLSFS